MSDTLNTDQLEKFFETNETSTIVEEEPTPLADRLKLVEPYMGKVNKAIFDELISNIENDVEVEHENTSGV